MVPLARPAESRCLRKVRKEADRADIVHSLRLPNIFPTFCHSLRSSRLTESGVVRFYSVPSSGKTHRVTSASRLSTVSSPKIFFLLCVRSNIDRRRNALINASFLTIRFIGENFYSNVDLHILCFLRRISFKVEYIVN